MLIMAALQTFLLYDLTEERLKESTPHIMAAAQQLALRRFKALTAAVRAGQVSLQVRRRLSMGSSRTWTEVSLQPLWRPLFDCSCPGVNDGLLHDTQQQPCRSVVHVCMATPLCQGKLV
jgi:hypothetical protein